MEFVGNDEYEQQEKVGTAETSTESQTQNTDTEKAPARPLFAQWDVGGQQYKLKLTPDEIMELERIYKRNLLHLMGDMDNMPSLTTMLQITHAAMKKWHHGIKLDKVKALYNQYIEAGGSLLQFYVEVFMKIYTVSGFFSTTMATEMTETMDEVAEKM